MQGAELGRLLQAADARRTLVNNLQSHVSGNRAAGSCRTSCSSRSFCLCPVVDLLFFGSIALWMLARAHFGPFLEFWIPGDVERGLYFFAAFLVVDLVTSLVAFLLERDEEWGLLLSLPFSASTIAS